VWIGAECALQPCDRASVCALAPPGCRALIAPRATMRVSLDDNTIVLHTISTIALQASRSAA
jgi:hypothetical protein